jgi:outer membrane protein OmpA-like peptidoglycan-associated protein
MKKNILRSSVLVGALLLGACSSMPLTTPMLDQARNDFASANNNAMVASYAPLEFKEASALLDQANAAAANKESTEKIDQLAYLAKQKIATAQEVAKRKAAEADIANAGKLRDQVRLDARTAEAERARMDAAAAQMQTAEAQRLAMEAEARKNEAQAKTAQLEAMMAELQAKKTERGMIITIGDVLFATGKAELMESGVVTLRKLADVLQKNPERTILVEGFTDNVGGDAYNQALSERRAGAVRSAIIGMGVAPERIAMRGYGETYPVISNDTAANRQLNRRVEIVLSEDGQPINPRR